MTACDSPRAKPDDIDEFLDRVGSKAPQPKSAAQVRSMWTRSKVASASRPKKRGRNGSSKPVATRRRLRSGVSSRKRLPRWAGPAADEVISRYGAKRK